MVNNTEDKFNDNSTGAVARYVQRAVTSITPSNMLDVFLDLNIQPSTTVKVYYKTGQSELPDAWTEMKTANGVNLVTTNDPEVFTETKFSTEKDGLLPEFFISQVKVVLLSANKTRVPRVKNYRSLAVNKF